MDNDITIRDATITQLTIAGYETLNDEETYLADCNGVKGLQISDATYIQLYVARLLTDAPVNADGYKIGEYVSFNEEPTTEPSTTPTTEPTTVPNTEPTTAPTTEPTTAPVTEPPKPDTITIKVGVIEYVYNETSSQTSSYKLHYWNSYDNSDADLVSLNTTEKVSVGSSYWSGDEQKFYMYTATVPSDTTGFKFHIGDRWFGDDGDTSKYNTVYIFNYSGDKAMYTKSSDNPINPTDPTTPPVTDPLITDANATIAYTFSGKNASTAGYAEGTVSLTSDKAGTYYLYWADDTKALDGYYEIAKLTLSANSTGTFKFGYHTAIPANATRIIATGSTSNLNVANALAQYKLPSAKVLSAGSGDFKYSFSSYSDIHIDPDGFYKNYEPKLKQALKYAHNKGTDFVVSSGDLVNFGTANEWDIYENILADSVYDNPIYESNGNHDLRADVTAGRKNFVRATGTDSTIANYDANKPYFYVQEKTTGDLFIFMALEGKYETHTVDSFSAEQINWVTNLLETYYNTGINIYIVEHAPIDGYGAGDRMDNPLYKAHLSQSFTSTLQFKALLEKYPKLIWMSGHTHIDFELDYNYSDENGTSCNMIHNSAVIGSTKANSTNDDLDRNNGEGFNSQGYYVEVYKNQVIYYGANLTDEKIYPAYCYIMEGSRNLGTAKDITDDNKDYGTSTTALTSIISTAQAKLKQVYTFASFDQYQAVKKLVNKYKNATNVSNTSAVVAEFEAKLADLDTITSHIGCLELYSTYYFVNRLNWSTVYGYAWDGSSKNAEWPGEKLQKVGIYNGYDVYEINFEQIGQYSSLIFSDGENQTNDIALGTLEGNCCIVYNDDMSNGKYNVQSFKYTPVKTSKYMLRYYNTGVHTWDDMDTYFTDNGDGTYTCKFTTTNANDINLNVYNTEKMVYNCVSESTTLTYANGATNTYSLTSSSSRGKSITINSLSAGLTITFVYIPASHTLKITCG